MRVCLTIFGGVLASQWLAAASIDEPMKRVTSVVRADAKSGRLVRSIVVAPRVAPSRAIASKVVGPDAGFAAPGATDVAAIVEHAAKTHDIDPLLVHSMIKVESNYNLFAVSPKGAMGLMQLMPATARQLGVKNVFDARQNIDGGVRYYKYLRSLYNDDRLALAAYNAGPGAVAKYGNVPPFPETIGYVYKVGKSYGNSKPRAAPPARGQAGGGEQYSKLEEVIDAEGRIYLRTR